MAESPEGMPARQTIHDGIQEMTFANKLKKERKRLGLTQAGLAALFAKDPKPPSVRVLWDWESGKVEPFTVTQEGILARLEKLKPQ